MPVLTNFFSGDVPPRAPGVPNPGGVGWPDDQVDRGANRMGLEHRSDDCNNV